MGDRFIAGWSEVLHRGRRYVYRGLHATMSVYPPQAELEDVETGDWITVPFAEVKWLGTGGEPGPAGRAVQT